MTQTSRLHHDLEIAQRAALALMTGLVVTAFLAFALGTAVYDVGNWLAIW